MRVLREADFRNLFFGQAASMLGDGIVFVALALYVTEIGSPSDVGLVLAAATFPLVLFLLLGGVWADRLPRHRLMIATDLIRFALHALLALLIFTGAVEIWHLVVIEALFGTAEAFFRPAYTGLVPQTVPEELIQEAKAAGSTIQTVAEFAGPALATALVLGVGAGWAFAVDALTFVISALLLARLRPRARGERALRQRLRVELSIGWRELRSRQWAWVVIAATSFALLLSLAPFFTLGPTVAEERYGSTGVFGALTVALGAGTVIGSFAGLRWRPLHPIRFAMAWAAIWAPAFALFALAPPLWVAGPLFVLVGFGFAMFDVSWDTALQERIPPYALSRVSSFDWMGSLALLPLGYLLAGPSGEAIGPAETVLIGGAVGVAIAALGFAIPDVWRLRALSSTT